MGDEVHASDLTNEFVSGRHGKEERDEVQNDVRPGIVPLPSARLR